ncbi:DUF6010 family protein [Streptosporangium carneum]|uniref:Uncharacterized protein n=1 Tax=Streptosporangium carneum TaxID=47481 RepID=A0A9W6I3A4_9ACTN|nr:DUF6010 family protein [Streptosporangium carneum]GLK10882.1 hypothetical protein GCM10017600_42880 [Streptosporangium carneum]
MGFRMTGRSWLTAGQSLYVVVVVVAMSYAIGIAAEADRLVMAALPFGAAIVLALCWLPDRVELAAWSAVTVWILAPTYLAHGGMEYAALAVVVTLVLLGMFRSPWFLVAAWLLHPVWDVAVPRRLEPPMTDLPSACVLYDLLVAGYLAYRAYRGCLVSFGRDADRRSVPR